MSDEDPIVIFCRRQRPRLLGMLTLYCGDREVAEELTQDTLARVWDRWTHVGQMPGREAYVKRMAINAANSRFRRYRAERRAREHLREPRAVEEDHAGRLAVRQAVATLPPRQRTALVLRFYSDLTVNEAAAIMRCAPGTVKALTHQAIQSLRRAGLIQPSARVEDV